MGWRRDAKAGRRRPLDQPVGDLVQTIRGDHCAMPLPVLAVTVVALLFVCFSVPGLLR